ncbi:MAG: tRNA threonylcarbamoyladenosine dehydratase, partial [Hallella bergensis]
TTMDPIAKILRKKMRKLNIHHLKVVFSEEIPLKPIEENESSSPKRQRPIPASIAFVPAAAGLIIGGEIIKDLISAAGTMRC